MFFFFLTVRIKKIKIKLSSKIKSKLIRSKLTDDGLLLISESEAKGLAFSTGYHGFNAASTAPHRAHNTARIILNCFQQPRIIVLEMDRFKFKV